MILRASINASPNRFFPLQLLRSRAFAFEALSPNALARQGWNRNSLQKGEEVTVEGYLAKDGKPLADGSIHANSKGVTRADGRKVFQGSSADDAYTK